MALNPELVLRSISPASQEGSPQRGQRGANAQDGDQFLRIFELPHSC
jgi:hypothetical protein